LEDYSKIELIKGEPVVAYKETVTEESSMICCSKSKNKLNRLFCTAKPLDENLVQAIESEKITDRMDAKVRARTLVEEFEWDNQEAKKIWCFGPDMNGPNLLIDAVSQA